MENDYCYIYNLKQALFFMQVFKLIPVDMAKGNRDVYVKFKRSDRTEEAFRIWKERGEEF